MATKRAAEASGRCTNHDKAMIKAERLIAKKPAT
jgi:hypothetical protein